MSLQIVAKKNHLHNVTTPYSVHASHSGIVDVDTLVSIMATSRTTLSAPDIMGTLILMKEEVAKLMADGKVVKTPLGNFYLGAKGTLESADQAFTPGEGGHKHGFRLRYRPDKDFADLVLDGTRVERAEILDRHVPVVLSVKPAETGVLDIQAGSYVRIQGQRLQFDPSDPDQGVFFVNGSTHRAARYTHVTSTLVLAAVPEGVAAGPYELSVRTLPNTAGIREGRAEKAVVVV